MSTSRQFRVVEPIQGNNYLDAGLGTVAYIGFGSNIQDRKKNLRTALKAIGSASGIDLQRISSLYQTQAVGFARQSDFLNAVAELDTEHTALELLEILSGIEAGMGRERSLKWGPRNIDLDLLLFGTQTIMNEKLSVPHPEMVRRKFVMIPLVEVNPNARHPIIGKTVADIWAGVPKDVKEQRLEVWEGCDWHV